jgi:bifunctional non-homologous end joining protein LigD
MPPFIAPLCTSVERPQSGSDWVHEIKFDGYRIQMRIESGKVTLKTRKGLDWTPKFCAIATAARALPDCIVDGRSSPWTIGVLPISGSAGRLVRWEDR